MSAGVCAGRLARKVRVTPHADAIVKRLQERIGGRYSTALCALIDQAENGAGERTRAELERILTMVAKHVGVAMVDSLPMSKAHRELREAVTWLEMARRVMGNGTVAARCAVRTP